MTSKLQNYPRLISYPEGKSFFLFGPRGTGKSSWVKSQFPKAVYLDLLESGVYNDMLAHPERLESFIPKGFDDWVVLDEIQRVPSLLNEVHRLIENRKQKFIMTGSSARKLRTKGVNLLAGRALTLHLYPLTAAELGKDFDVRRSLRFGQLPSAYVENDPKAYLDSYVTTYLREEVQQEGLTRNLEAFSRFLEAASFSQAAVLNVTNVARECSIERKIVENYFSIVEDLLLGFKLPLFTKRAKRRLVGHPKFFFFDVGVYRTLRPMGPLDRPEEAEGPAYETLVLQELKAMNGYRKFGYQLSYWRTSYGLEVDFVLYGPRGLLAFEVKRTAKVRPQDTAGLRAFLQDYPQAKAFLIYGGDRRMRDGEIDVIPFERFFKELPAILETH